MVANGNIGALKQVFEFPFIIMLLLISRIAAAVIMFKYKY